MVQKIFWEDPYQTQTAALVTGVQGNVVTLDKTVAFAYPGGQVFDTGTIGAYPILDAKYDGREIYYTVPAGHTLKTSDPVPVTIIWDRRYAIMKLHFAAELLLAVLFNKYGMQKMTRADILEDRAILEFLWDGDISETFSFLEGELEKLIAADHNIISGYIDREQEKRYWEISGFAKVPCGGTHLKKTGEIGTLKLARLRPDDGKEGIEITLLAS
jgi:Ser-tRNA(Ala) deacylase AlaX